MKAAGLAALVVLLACGCSSSDQAVAGPSPHVFQGGCAGTVLTEAEPPVWSQGGWSHENGTPWPVPWALAKPGDAIAFVFANELVAGSSPRSDGSANKVLWVVRDAQAFVVDGRPLGQSQPVMTFAGGPSVVDVPTAGCWTFQVIQGKPGAEHRSVIDLQVLPAGTLPA
jgi:hypothetical protein